MTIKQKLDEINESIQTSYGHGEIFFRGTIQYLISEFETVINYVSSIEPNLKCQNDKDYLSLANSCHEEVKRVLSLQANGFVEDKHLNGIKQNSTNLYWTFIQSIERYEASILNKEFKV